MPTLPAWVWSGIICFLLGAVGAGIIVIQIRPDKDSGVKITTDTPTQNSDNEDLIILVRDSKTKEILKDVELEITVKEGLVQGRTLDNGTYRFQVPKQKLGEFKVLLRKQDYQQKEIPINFSINPDEPKTIYLESVSTPISQPPPSSFISPPEAPVLLTTNKTVYPEGEEIQFTYTGLNSELENRITLVKSSHPERQVTGAIYYRNVGEKGSDNFYGLKPGEYEVRAYFHYAPGNNYKLVARVPIKVE